jgi:alpha-glucuronidase
VADLSTPSWNPAYFHKAGSKGIGFDRTATGSNAVAQYAPEIALQFADVNRVPEELLLWFHHVPWSHRMKSGETLWNAMVTRYDRGVETVQAMQAQWRSLKPFIDAQRHSAVTANLRAQHLEATWWRDASIAYWQSINELPLPEGHAPPAHPLWYYRSIKFENLPGNP